MWEFANNGGRSIRVALQSIGMEAISAKTGSNTLLIRGLAEIQGDARFAFVPCSQLKRPSRIFRTTWDITRGIPPELEGATRSTWGRPGLGSPFRNPRTISISERREVASAVHGRVEPLDDTRRKEIAALLAIGMDPATLAKVTGIPAEDFPDIIKGVKERDVLHRTAAKRGRDVRCVISTAATYQEALLRNPWAPVPESIEGIVKPRVEIDPGLIGLDRRIVVVFSKRNTDTMADTMFQVGVEDAWTSVDMLAGRYVVPAGAQATEGWNLQVGWGRASLYIDVAVGSMVQSINPNSLHLLRNVMDWGLWRLRAEYVVKHDEVIERFDSYKHRAIVTSSPNDASSSTSNGLDHELASRLVGGMVSGDRTAALECRDRQAWAPFVTFDRTWSDEWLDRLVLVLYDPPVQGKRQLDAFAHMFPVTTLYTGDCRVWYGAGKSRTRRVAIVDALVPQSNLTIMTDHVLAVASIITPEVLIMPECTTPIIPYPAGYPAGDITRVYKPGGRRASSVQEKRLYSFEEHWAAQQALEKR